MIHRQCHYYVFLCCSGGGGGGTRPLLRQMSDFGPSHSWDSYGGGGGRRFSGQRRDGYGGGGGGRRFDDGGSTISAENWDKPLARNDRLERLVDSILCVCACGRTGIVSVSFNSCEFCAGGFERLFSYLFPVCL